MPDLRQIMPRTFVHTRIKTRDAVRKPAPATQDIARRPGRASILRLAPEANQNRAHQE
ncbi:hypothetical protein [Terrihabitans soli]|uniref:hypothetical protein n=1 Tax=Terrihabitans soli TaxID=708113 RepID=UPI001CA36EED|nr:hypothetical protein [Terrihabitans soli]